MGDPGDEQWDDRFGGTTNLVTGPLALYQDAVYASTHKWDGTNLVYWSPPLGSFYSDMAVIGTNLFVAGEIYGRDFGPGISRWDGAKWNQLDHGISVGGYGPHVQALATLGNDLYVSGSFDPISPPGGSGILRWDGTNWSALGQGLSCQDSPGFPIGVFALAVKENILYAGGGFDTAGDVSAYHFAKWDGLNWSAVDDAVFGPDSAFVSALAVSGKYLYVAIEPGPSSKPAAILRWNGVTFSNLGTTDGVIYKFAFSGSDLFVGGHFNSVNGVPANNIARWDGMNWHALGAGLSGGRYPLAWGMLVWRNDLIVTGDFSLAGGKPSPNFAIWHLIALRGVSSGGSMQLSWPAFATNYLLESNSGLTSNGWTAVSPSPQTNSYTVPISGSTRYFRLRQP